MNERYHEICYEPAGAKTAVLLLHGILSAPQFFAFLRDELPQEFAVYAPLLAGHGDDTAALAGAGMEQWKEQIHVLAENICSRYENVLVIAHSMGTLFAVQTALRFPEKIRHMVLLGVPMCVHLTPDGTAHFVIAGLGIPLNEPTPRFLALLNSYSITPDANLSHYLPWLPRYQELFREILRTRPLMQQITVPCDVFQFARDELVSLRSLPFLAGNPNLRCRVLRHAAHFYYPEPDAGYIRRAVKRACAKFIQNQ